MVVINFEINICIDAETRQLNNNIYYVAILMCMIL